MSSLDDLAASGDSLCREAAEAIRAIQAARSETRESQPTYAEMDAARNAWWADLSKAGDPAQRTSSLGSFGDGFFAGFRAARSSESALREQMLEVAYMLLVNDRRGDALKWARGLTGNIAANDKLTIKLEEIADLCVERDNLRAQIASASSAIGPTQAELMECLKFWRNYSSLNESGQDDLDAERHSWLDKMEDWAT